MQACLVKDMGYLSVCGHVSRYLGMIPDYQVAADLARNIQKFTRSAGKPLEDLERMESEFRRTVEEAVASNPLLASIVAAAEQAERQPGGRRPERSHHRRDEPRGSQSDRGQPDGGQPALRLSGRRDQAGRSHRAGTLAEGKPRRTEKEARTTSTDTAPEAQLRPPPQETRSNTPAWENPYASARS